MVLIKIKKKLSEIMGIENDYYKIEDIFFYIDGEILIYVLDKTAEEEKIISFYESKKLVETVAKAHKKLSPYGFAVRMGGEE